MGRWMFSALPFAGSAAILLFSIRGSTIADDIFASAVRALHGDRDHQTFYFFQDFCFYSITAFSFCPLPPIFLTHQLARFGGLFSKLFISPKLDMSQKFAKTGLYASMHRFGGDM
jgi:hypothetical protein